MKNCSICKSYLPLECYDTQSTGKMGRRADCKDCRKRFTQSPHGLVKTMYRNQKAKSKKRGHPPPSFTELQLYDWVWSQPHIQNLYAKWVDSGHNTDFKPSVDRLDDYLPYALNNIQLTTVKENVDRYPRDAVSGINTKSATPVMQLSLQGDYIQTFYSYSEAARVVNGLVSNIRNVAEGVPIERSNSSGSKRSWIPATAYGYIWKKP